MTKGLGSEPVEPVRETGIGDETAGQAPPRALDVVLVGAVLEAAALGAAVVWAVLDLVAGRSTNPGATAALGVFLLAVAAAVVAAARALRRGARRARGLLVTWQVLQAASAWTLLGTPDAPAALPWAAGAALVLAVVVLVAVLSPASLAYTAAHDVTPED